MFPVKYVHLFTFLILSSACPALRCQKYAKGWVKTTTLPCLSFALLTFGCSSFLSFSLSGIPALASRCWGYVSGSNSHYFFQQWPCLAILCPHHLFKAGQVRSIRLPCGSQKEEFWHKTVWRVKHRQQGERRGSRAFFALSSPLTCKWTHIPARGCTYT